MDDLSSSGRTGIPQRGIVWALALQARCEPQHDRARLAQMRAWQLVSARKRLRLARRLGPASALTRALTEQLLRQRGLW